MNISVTSLFRSVLDWYSYRCLCKSFKGVTLLIKCCITALLYKKFYLVEKKERESCWFCGWEGALNTHTLSYLEGSKAVRYRRNPFSCCQRGSLHHTVLILLFNKILYYQFLPSTTTFHWLVEGICSLAGGCQPGWVYWEQPKPWAKMLCKGGKSGSWPCLLPQTLDFLGWKLWGQQLTLQRGIREVDIWVGFPWKLPGTSGGDLLWLLIMLFLCIFFPFFLLFCGLTF